MSWELKIRLQIYIYIYPYMLSTLCHLAPLRRIIYDLSPEPKNFLYLFRGRQLTSSVESPGHRQRFGVYRLHIGDVIKAPGPGGPSGRMPPFRYSFVLVDRSFKYVQ